MIGPCIPDSVDFHGFFFHGETVSRRRAPRVLKRLLEAHMAVMEYFYGI